MTYFFTQFSDIFESKVQIVNDSMLTRCSSKCIWILVERKLKFSKSKAESANLIQACVWVINKTDTPTQYNTHVKPRYGADSINS